ncbi:gliding motility-associated C-terminal domain-containing protein [Flavobacterium bizetiae]|uniref:gliding motility-associated C-terminal domain-containing protein n=1 Tax=Flavobacterium bizetiae TaxID=2704140 RepID=UPI0021E82FEE|nr:gliding motility-associated C-terminal domain-containing protein [Flavobacterium bizetiae]UTN03422.1 gliding motility-associated C-terminal domain-containing protein [Flavobacterium bizetiae]
MKSKITLFLVLIMLPVLSFTGNIAFAQTVSGTPSNKGCAVSGIVTASSTGLGSTVEYQLLKSGVVVMPVPGNASVFATNNVFENLENGSYTVKARAASGQTVYTSNAITVTDGYTNMTVSGQAQVANCPGGSAVLTAVKSGGKAPFTYKIALQSSPNAIIQTSTSTTAGTFLFNALAAGSYVISVTDDCGQTATGATSVSNPMINLDQVKVYLTPYPTKAGLVCSNPIRLKIEGGFRYVSSNQPLSAADEALFTWKIKYKGDLYGKDTDGDGYADKNGDGFDLSTSTPIMPKIADRAGILDDMANMKVVLLDHCGGQKEFSIYDYNKNVSYLSLGNCNGMAVLKSSIAEGLDCLPINLTLTNQSNRTEVHNVTVTSGGAQTFTAAMTPGAYYDVTYVDAEGYTKNLYTAASSILLFNAVSNYTIGQNISAGYITSLNDLEYGYLQLKIDPVQSNDRLTYTVSASNNPKVAVGYTNSALLSSFQNGASGFPLLTSPNPSDPSPFWPKGNYTLDVNTPCGTQSVNVVVQGRTASLNGNTITPVCGGFNYVMNGNFDVATAYQVIVLSGPSSVGQTRDLASITASLPFNSLSYGTYVFGLRIKGGTKNVLTQTVTYDVGDIIKVDRSKTGGYVCTEGSQDGTLTISALSKSLAPNDVLTYALSTNGGSTYGAYQSSNMFSGLSSGTYYFKVKDGCGNEITQTSQIGVATAPVIDVNGLMSKAEFCPNTSGSMQLDVDVLNAASYFWTGPGITTANQNLKSPSVNYSDLAVGANNYTCTVKIGAPCNTENEASVIITGLPLPIFSVNNPLAVCFPNTVDLTAPAVTSGNVTGLSYFTDNLATVALTTPKAVSTSGTYYIKATNGQCSTILPVVVTVNPLPIATITYPNGPYCNRGTAVVTHTGLNGGIYSGDTGLVVDPSTGEINLTASTAGNHTVTYTFNNGTCSNSTTSIVTINATALPTALSDITGQCSVAKPTAPTLVDPCAGGLTATTNTSFPITKLGETEIIWVFDYGNNFTQTVTQKVIISETALKQAVSTTCASDGSGYILNLNVTGEGPYTITGTGAPGTWSGSAWTSGTISRGTNYNVNIQDKYKCNTLSVSGIAPVCCVFEVTSPTFPTTTITCYDQLPTATKLTTAEFEALGKGDGIIGNNPCGVIEITASNSVDPGCNGNVTRTYTVTEYADPNNNKVRDLGENTVLNTSTCTQIFTIERADFVMPVNTGTTVACASLIVAPTVPEVKDNCGNVVTPTLVISSTPQCNGDVTYTYTFTDCAGNAHDWVYTYAIKTVDFVMPANTGTTVACASLIVAPTVPEVKDNCGNVLTPTLVISSTPQCNGDVTYTYTFTDCAGNAHDWVYTYAIKTVDFVMPANAGTTVACASLIVAPTVPEVKDNCGNVLTPTLIISPTPQCNGDVTYTYTFTDCAGNAHEWVYTYAIKTADFVMPANAGTTVACASLIVTPTVPEVKDNCGNVLTPTLVISPTPQCNGDVTYTYTFTDCAGNTYDWVYTYTIETVDFVMPVNAGTTVACASLIVAPTVPEVRDNCGNVLTPVLDISPTPQCNGKVVYTYTFTDCIGNKHDWQYTYTIESVDFVMPNNAGTTVACASLIVAPTVPEVKDNCGNVLTPVLDISPTPECNGKVVYTYTFTDCIGNKHDWEYTYTIESVDFIMPNNAGTTVACASLIVAPTVPEVKDNCGNVLTPVLDISPTPECNGKVVYTYTFTDCIGNKHDWEYTYTIETVDFVMPANAGSIVACLSSVVEPTVPEVKDNCGNVLTVSAPIISDQPECNGEVTYTYKFTDCTGNTHDWVYTYTINNTLAPTGKAPADLKVQCIEDIPAANINAVTNTVANCNGEINVTVEDTNNGGRGCKGEPYIVTRTFTLTDCGGLKTILVQKIIAEDTTAPVFVETLPANIVVDCAIEIPVAPTLTAVDNCSVANVVYDEVKIDGNCSGNYQLQRTWTASDSCGNETVYTQVITVSDTTAPVFVESLPESVVNATCETIPDAVTLTASDTCGTATVEYTETKVDGDCSSKHDLIRVWTATDDCGNQNTFKQTIHVSCLPEIFNAISPNGDGINDTFKIGGIDCYPNNNLRIYNRYGVLIYEKERYDNVTDPFEGFSDGRATVKRGDKLPTGTYFYTLEYNDDNQNRVEKAGYLYINNN